MNTINSNTIVTCQHCGKLTNIADEPSYRNLLARAKKAEKACVEMRSAISAAIEDSKPGFQIGPTGRPAVLVGLYAFERMEHALNLK